MESLTPDQTTDKTLVYLQHAIGIFFTSIGVGLLSSAYCNLHISTFFLHHVLHTFVCLCAVILLLKHKFT